jgi:hypothetical protein
LYWVFLRRWVLYLLFHFSSAFVLPAASAVSVLLLVLCPGAFGAGSAAFLLLRLFPGSLPVSFTAVLRLAGSFPPECGGDNPGKRTLLLGRWFLPELQASSSSMGLSEGSSGEYSLSELSD